MDVRAWLQNTADREPPDEQDRADFPDYLRPERYTAEEHTRAHQGRRKRALSEPHSAPRGPSRGRDGGHERAASPDSSSDHARDGISAASSRSSPSVGRREPSSDRRVNKTFERRARHKTKEDRYEPRAKHRRRGHESRKDHTSKSKLKSKRRKSLRSGDGARTAGLVTSFQLKDRPRNNRLTLRPADVSTGIFKHGRAGAPITRKGFGLPDLVFNEMRFLRRPREHQDEFPHEHPDQERSERTDKQQEGNISTYFAKPHTKAPYSREQQRAAATGDQDPGPRSPAVQDGAQSHQRREDRDGDAAGGYPANSFLGFGSRGLHQEVSNAKLRSNSCYTWSESDPAAKSSVRDALVQTKKSMTHGAAYPLAPATKDLSHFSTYLDDRPGDLVKPPRAARSTARCVHSKRASGSASVEELQPAVSVQTSHRENALPTNHGSSFSLPRSGADLPPPHGHAINRQGVLASCSTSDILRIRDDYRTPGDRSTMVSRSKLSDKYSGKENQEPATSTPTSKLLRHALHTIAGPQTRAPSNTHRTDHDAFEDLERNTCPALPSDDTVYYHTRMAAEDPQNLGQASKQHTFGMPQRGFSRLTDGSHAKQQQPVARPATRAFSFMNTAAALPRTAHRPFRSHAIAPDDEMLDNVPSHWPATQGQQYLLTNKRQAEDLMRRLTSNEQREIFAPQRVESGYLPTALEGQGECIDEAEGVGFLRTDSDVAGLSMGNPHSHAWSITDVPHSAPDPGGGEVQHERMPPFWKPNKLY